MSIATKTGDGGETGLLGGARVSKAHPRLEALGTLDELNAVLGWVLSLGGLEPPLTTQIQAIQRDLLSLGAQLAQTTPVTLKGGASRFGLENLAALDGALADREERLPPLKNFILPGGTAAAAGLHLARAVCRRAERAVVALCKQDSVDPAIMAYLNRLSDLLFVLAREVNLSAGQEETVWSGTPR